MVFETTAAHEEEGGAHTNACLYTYIQHLHPSVQSGDDHVMRDHIEINISNGTISPPPPIPIERQEEVIHRKFTNEHLFEVVVMYLFNGLKAASFNPQTEETIDTVALLHYLVYVIPEADKLHVTHSEQDTLKRMEYVRVVFDHVDYRFRVLVNKTAVGGGWADICIELRQKFKDIVAQIVISDKSDLEEHWVAIVKGFREHLIEELSTQTGQDKTDVTKWVLNAEDIQW